MAEIYVDALFDWSGISYSGPDAAEAARVGARNGHQWCHLFSDEQDPAFPALHAFAAKLGLRRAWFQGDHYDLTPSRRAAAVRAGAKEATRAEAVAIWKRTPRARRYRCSKCDHVTERRISPPDACPSCGAARG